MRILRTPMLLRDRSRHQPFRRDIASMALLTRADHNCIVGVCIDVKRGSKESHLEKAFGSCMSHRQGLIFDLKKT